MIYTSYFAKLKSLPDNVMPISICAKAPIWYNGLQYKILAPKYDFFIKWKETHDNDFYIRCFNEQVLNGLDVYEVVDTLYNLLPEKEKLYIDMTNCPPWENPNVSIALVCYEKPTDFCHRHLVSEWFNKNGIRCEEWQ